MRTWVGVVVLGLAGLAGTRIAAQPGLPVVSMAYDGAVGSTETEEETLEDSSFRHQATLRLREEWSDELVTTLVGELMRKVYVEGTGVSYGFLQISPQLRWAIADGLTWSTSMLARRALYDLPYASGYPRDYTRLKADTGLSVSLVKGLSLASRLLAAWELYDDSTKSRQTYAVDLGLDARLGQWSLGADYRGSLRLPMGPVSLTTSRLDHTFGADVSWDPNR